MVACKEGDSRLCGISSAIRIVLECPKPKIMFQDITTLLLNINFLISKIEKNFGVVSNVSGFYGHIWQLWPPFECLGIFSWFFWYFWIFLIFWGDFLNVFSILGWFLNFFFGILGWWLALWGWNGGCERDSVEYEGNQASVRHLKRNKDQKWAKKGKVGMDSDIGDVKRVKWGLK